MNGQTRWDVIVVGVGAAGMMAATRTAHHGLRTLLVEKNRKLGVKILISGGTRCNLTHDAEAPEVAAAFAKRQGQFLRSALAALPPKRLVAMFEREGVLTKVEETGKVFPVSDRPLDVRDALVRMLRRADCHVLPETPVLGLTRHTEHYEVRIPTGHITGSQRHPCLWWPVLSRVRHNRRRL